MVTTQMHEFIRIFPDPTSFITSLVIKQQNLCKAQMMQNNNCEGGENTCHESILAYIFNKIFEN